MGRPAPPGRWAGIVSWRLCAGCCVTRMGLPTVGCSGVEPPNELGAGLDPDGNPLEVSLSDDPERLGDKLIIHAMSLHNAKNPPLPGYQRSTSHPKQRTLRRLARSVTTRYNSHSGALGDSPPRVGEPGEVGVEGDNLRVERLRNRGNVGIIDKVARMADGIKQFF